MNEIVHSRRLSLPFETCLSVCGTAANVGLLVVHLQQDTLIEHLADLKCDLRPVHLGHAVVEQYQTVHGRLVAIHLLDTVLNGLYRLLTVHGLVALDFALAEQSRKHLNVHGVVVNDQD